LEFQKKGETLAPMKLGGWIILACSGIAAPAMAGNLYRCMGADGVPNYSSHRVSNAVCKVVSTDQARVSISSKSTGPHESSFTSRTSGSTPGLSVVSTTPVSAAPTATPAVASAATQTATTAPASNRNVVFRTAPEGGVLTASAASGGARITRGAVYKFEQDGITHYTNIKPVGVPTARMLFSYMETCYACSPLPGVNFGTVSLNTAAYRAEISSAAQEFGVEEAVVRAIIHAESAFRANARSYKGAQGLMQLIPATAARFGVVDPYDPAQNIHGGVAYLAWLMQRYSSNLSLVAAAYNAGEGAVDRNGGVPPYAETQRYVERVGQLADRYRTALTSAR
jgi:hypothetical protein